MARIRTIKPEFWTDDLLGALSREARMLFIASWNLADDEGLLRWNSAYLKGAVFPFDDDLNLKRMDALMKELASAQIIFPYRGGRSQQPLAYIVNFHKHQKINRPSPTRLPPPSLQVLDVKEMYRRRDGNTCHLCKGQIDQTATEVPVVGGWNDDFCLSIDHLTPVSKGGTDAPSNVRCAHQTCNKGRCNRAVKEYQDLLASGITSSQRASPERFKHWLDGSSVSNSLNDSVLEQEGEKEQGTGNGKESLAVGEFDSFFAVFPKQEQRDNAEKAYAAAIEAGAKPSDLIAGAQRFAAHVEREKIPLKFVALAKTWLKEGHWKDQYGAAPSGEVVLPPMHESWPKDVAARWSKNLGEVQFRTYFGPAEYIDAEPPRLRFPNRNRRSLAEAHFPKVAKEVALEVAA